MGIVVRRFEPRDQSAARALILEGLGGHFGAIDETLNPDLNDIAALHAAGVFLVACDGDQNVGTGALTPLADGVRGGHDPGAPTYQYNQQMRLPERFIQNVTHVLGDEGRAWLDALPSLLASCEHTYDLAVGQPFELAFNYVAPVTRADGSEAVLKLSPHGEDFRHELAAIRYFDGKGMSRLLESDEALGMALLERLRPGMMLLRLDDDDRQTEIAAEVMLDLRREPPADFELPTTRDWFAAFDKHRTEHNGGPGPLPLDVFQCAESTYEQLLQSSAAPVLLHGDLHHYNILSAERAPWLAIDPHGLVGEPAFETGAYLGNPRGMLARRTPNGSLSAERTSSPNVSASTASAW